VAPADHDELAARLRDNPSRAGVFCDFDGTLADIVERPEDARPAEGAVDALAALVEPYSRVQVISGRPARFLLSHLGGRGLHLAGLYGLEVVREGEVQVAEDAKGWEPTVEEAVARLEEQAPEGLHIEAKGLSVTLHFRTAPELADTARTLAEEAAESSGLVVGEGRQSYELRPPVSTSKGTVLAEAAADLDAACFLGDDHGDLTAFDALDDLAEAGAETLRVGVQSAEAPDELLERADIVVDGPTEVVDLLRSLIPADA
jgi:trehalose 6-phosphate phosphatase